MFFAASFACAHSWNKNGITSVGIDIYKLNTPPLTRFGVRYLVRKYAARAQSTSPSMTGKRVSPHTFRHTTAMHLLRSGNDVIMVSYWRGHANLNTTHVYLDRHGDETSDAGKGHCAHGPRCLPVTKTWYPGVAHELGQGSTIMWSPSANQQ